ncbi:MAG: hypothetical protein AB7O67_04370 [Vicinamibacterales bacterium]
MKTLFIVQHVNFFRNLDTVMRELAARGHDVVFLHGTRLDDPRLKDLNERKAQKIAMMTRGLQVAQSEIPGVTTGYRPEPDEPWQRALLTGRLVMNRATYFRADHPAPERTVDGIEKELPEAWRARVHAPAWKAVLRRPAGLRAWRWIEAASAPSPSVTALLREVAPDVVVASPTIWPKSPVEADYIRAARALGLPTIGYLNSWDNLTSKGTIHVLPETYIVWNEALAREAVDLHDVPPGTIRITGAPHLDHFFGMRPVASRAELCARMGCPDDRPFLVFLCSSRTIFADEVPLVNRLVDALERQFPAGAAPTLVVRPHPTNPFPFAEYTRPGVVVHPRQGDQADTPAAWQEYFDQLAQSAAVFGLNTTAFLEAVVADRPCLTIVADEFHGAQGRTGHFRHLLQGGFLEVSADAGEVARRVARILDGADERREGRRDFVRWFIRPCGDTTPAAGIVADVIERAALPHAGAATPAVTALVPGLTLDGEGVAR